jgi:hypothetical protein
MTCLLVPYGHILISIDKEDFKNALRNLLGCRVLTLDGPLRVKGRSWLTPLAREIHHYEFSHAFKRTKATLTHSHRTPPLGGVACGSQKRGLPLGGDVILPYIVFFLRRFLHNLSHFLCPVSLLLQFSSGELRFCFGTIQNLQTK